MHPTPLCEAKVRVRLPTALLQLDMGFCDVSRPLPLQFHKSAVDAQAAVEPWCPDNCRSALKHSQEYLAGGNLLWLSLTRHPCDNVVIDELSYKDIEQLARLMNLRPGSIESARLRKQFLLSPRPAGPPEATQDAVALLPCESRGVHLGAAVRFS